MGNMKSFELFPIRNGDFYHRACLPTRVPNKERCGASPATRHVAEPAANRALEGSSDVIDSSWLIAG